MVYTGAPGALDIVTLGPKEDHEYSKCFWWRANSQVTTLCPSQMHERSHPLSPDSVGVHPLVQLVVRQQVP